MKTSLGIITLTVVKTDHGPCNLGFVLDLPKGCIAESCESQSRLPARMTTAAIIHCVEDRITVRADEVRGSNHIKVYLEAPRHIAIVRAEIAFAFD